MMSRSLLLLAILPAASAFSCSSGSRIQCMAVKNLESKIAIPEEHTGFEASVVPMCTPFGEKVYCLPQHDDHECQEGYAPCCDYPDHHSNFEHHDDITCSPAVIGAESEAIVFDDQDATVVNMMTDAADAALEFCASDAYKQKFHHDFAKNKGNASMSFTFDPPMDGCYKLEEYHPGSHEECSKHLPTNAVLKVDFCYGLSWTGSINQAANPARWNEVGSWPFYKGTKGKLTLSNSESEQCVDDECFLLSDAFRLTWNGFLCAQAMGQGSPGEETKEGTLLLTVESLESTEDVRAALARHHGKLEATLAARYSYREVGIMDISVSGRRLEARTNSTVMIRFLAKGTINTQMPGDLADRLNSVFELAIPTLKLVAAEISEMKDVPVPVPAPAPASSSPAPVSLRAPLRVQAPEPADSEAIVLDDMDASLVAQKDFFEGTLAPAECMIDAYKMHFHHDWAMNKGSATFSYIFEPPKDGCYMIEEHHPGQHAACSQHLPTNAILDVDYCKGLKTSYSVNQATNPAQWNEVGNLIFYKGFKGKLTLRNSNGEQCSSDTCYLTADAFRLTWIASRCPAAAYSNGDAEAKEGTLVLGVESASSSEEVRSTLNRHQAKLEITLAAHLDYRLVDIVSTTLVTGRRLLVDSADEQSITTSRYEMRFSAKGSMDTKQPGNLVDLLNSALKTVAPGMKVVSADVNWQATADTQDTFKLICLIAVVVAVVVVSACVVIMGCLRRRKRQSPATKDDVDEEKQDVVQVTPAEGWNVDALVAGIKDSEKEEKTWETYSGSTQEPASEDTKSDASLVVVQERSATEVVPAEKSVGEVDV